MVRAAVRSHPEAVDGGAGRALFRHRGRGRPFLAVPVSQLRCDRFL